MLRAALWYAQCGFAVFPVHEPLFDGTGQLTGCTCEAYRHKETFAGDVRALHETVTAITGGGGEHYWYRQPPGSHYGNDTGDLPLGLDVRGEGGYIVAPPSLHRSGSRYRFEHSYAPHEIDTLILPETIRLSLGSNRHAQARRVSATLDREAVGRAAATVERVLTAAGLGYAAGEWGEGMKFVLERCPFNPPDNPHADKGDDAVVVVEADGTIGAMCQHARCRRRIQEEAPKTVGGQPSACCPGWHRVDHACVDDRRQAGAPQRT